jgi:biopolymer transport protein ExbD
MTYFAEEPEAEYELNIVPMIDVIFAILTFFIISSLLLSRSQSLPVNLPKAASSELQQRTRITVTVEESGTIAVNRETITLGGLQEAVRQRMGPARESVVLIHADEAVNHGRVVAVMDELRAIDGAALGISTRPAQ